MASRLVLVTFLVCVTALAGQVYSQEVLSAREDNSLGDINYSHEERFSGEETKPDEEEREFEASLLATNGRPRLPNVDEVQRAYEGQVAILKSSRSADQELLKAPSTLTSAKFSYLDLNIKGKWKCCPKKVGYSCVHVNHKLPCFYHWNGLNSAWCCPIWPSPITYARCICDQCAVLTSWCANEGRCRPVYQTKGFLAVCFNKWWGSLRWIKKSLPKRCYCKI